MEYQKFKISEVRDNELSYIYKWLKRNKLIHEASKELGLRTLSNAVITFEHCIESFNKSGCQKIWDWGKEHGAEYQWLSKNNKLLEFKKATAITFTSWTYEDCVKSVIDNNYTLTQFRKLENSKYRFILRNGLIKKFSEELNLSNRRITYSECVNIIKSNNYSWKDFYTNEASKYAYLTKNGFVEKIRKECNI